jgi:uncharacterized protein YeaO (DUF488 family)
VTKVAKKRAVTKKVTTRKVTTKKVVSGKAASKRAVSTKAASREAASMKIAANVSGASSLLTTHARALDLKALEAVRDACLTAITDAYEDAGIQGLCGEGRWEAAVAAARTLDLRAVVDEHASTPAETLRLKRAYDPPSADDGLRILVDRLWPRGLRRDQAALDAWLPEVAPSPALRRWFGHAPERWTEFVRRYTEELDAQPSAARALAARVRRRTATLIYAARDPEHNHALALRRYLRQRFRV